MPKMSITVTAQMRNGLLWEAVKKLGSQSAVARYLGIGATEFGCWLNLKRFPDPERSRRPKTFWAQIDLKLIQLLGKTFDDAFPVELRSQDALDLPTRIEVTREVETELLLASGLATNFLEAANDEIDNDLLHHRLEQAMETLKPRHRQVIEMRFGLQDGIEATLEETGEALGVQSERARQIEAKALAIMRHPARTRNLKPFVDIEYGKPQLWRALPCSDPKHAELFTSTSKHDQCFALEDSIQCVLTWFQDGLCRIHWFQYVGHSFKDQSAAIVRCSKCLKRVMRHEFSYDFTACPKKTVWEGCQLIEK